MRNLVDLYKNHKGKLSDKWEYYIESYERHFREYRNRPIRLLEIGVQNGGSLEIWSKYFDKAEVIVGCDINPDCAKLMFDDARISVVAADVNTDSAETMISAYSSSFDLIIDDGSHLSGDVVRTFVRYFKYLNENGLFVVEDLHCSYWAEYEGGLYHPYSAVSFFKRLADIMNHDYIGGNLTREAFLQGFAKHYNIGFDEGQLASIHSIEFSNSLCFLKKCSPENNNLGKRWIVGRQESILSGLRELSNPVVVLADNQDQNPFGAHNVSIEEGYFSLLGDLRKYKEIIENQKVAIKQYGEENKNQRQVVTEQDHHISNLNRIVKKQDDDIAVLEKTVTERTDQIMDLSQTISEHENQIAELQTTIREIYRSTSWRISAPIRFIGRKRYQIRKLFLNATRMRRQNESIKDLVAKAMHVWRRDGLKRVMTQCYQRYSAVNLTNTNPAANETSVIPAAIVRDSRGHYALSSQSNGYIYIEPQRPTDIDTRLAALKVLPLFSVVVPVFNTPPNLLERALGSVQAQWYPHWQIVLVNDASTNEDTLKSLTRIKHPNIKVLNLKKNQGISGATNAGIAAADGDFIVFMDHDDELTVDCLYELAVCIHRENPDYIYSDEDKITSAGELTCPHFKPDWSPDTMMSTMYTCHVSCVRRSVLNRVGELRPKYDGCQDWELVLRIAEHTNRISHIPKVLYHWRMVPGSTSLDMSAKSNVFNASRMVRLDALERRGLKGSVEPVEQVPGYFRVNYHLTDTPMISIIIPTRDNGRMLRRCIRSIKQKSRYRRFEIIIVDNGSVDSSTRIDLQKLHDLEGIRVIRHDAPFNYSELNNIAVKHSKGELLLFLNDDTEVLSTDWLNRMGGYAQLPHIGAVGAKLLYPGGKKIQHAGVINFANGPDHAFLHQNKEQPGYFMRNLLEYNWLAVTGACLMMETKKFNMLGGFNEKLPVAYNDVDLCIRSVEKGYYNIVCQAVSLIHHESASRGNDLADIAKLDRLQKELGVLYSLHPTFYQYDPFFNPNLHPNGKNFEVPL